MSDIADINSDEVDRQRREDPGLRIAKPMSMGQLLGDPAQWEEVVERVKEKLVDKTPEQLADEATTLEREHWLTYAEEHDVPDIFWSAKLGEGEQTFAMRAAAVYMRDHFPNRRALWLRGDTGRGKCVAETEVITLADGARVKAGDLVKTSFQLLSMVDGMPVPVDAKAEWNTYEQIWEVVTDSGRRILRSGRHPLWRGRRGRYRRASTAIESLGWCPVNQFSVGDLVAVTRELPAFGTGMIPDHEVKILAYMIGDGSCTQRSSIAFAQACNAQLREFRESVEAMGCVLAANGRYNYRIVASTKVLRGANTINPVIDLLRHHGVMGSGSGDKRIPEAIYRSPAKTIRLFLSRLFSTDGWASTATPRGARINIEVGYASNSEALARGVAELLMRFGIRATLTRRSVGPSWTVSLKSVDEIRRFADSIGIYGKEAALERVLEAAEGRDEKRCHHWRLLHVPPGTFWERVRSVARSNGLERTVAIEVPRHHTYLTSFWEHNSHAAAACLRAAGHGWFLDFSDLCVDLISPGREERAYHMARKKYFVVFDDFGAQYTKHGGALESKIEAILRYRESHRLPTIVTTNLTREDMEKELPQPVLSRLRGPWVVGWDCTGPDMRTELKRRTT